MYIGVLFCILRSLREEVHVKSTEHVIALSSTFLQGFESNARSVDFAVNICTCLLGILGDSKNMHTLPAADTGQIWRDFHKLRFSPTLYDTWSSYLIASLVPSLPFPNTNLRKRDKRRETASLHAQLIPPPPPYNAS